MILAGSLEFEKSHNNEVQERETDNIDIPTVLKYHQLIEVTNIQLTAHIQSIRISPILCIRLDIVHLQKERKLHYMKQLN